MIRIIYRYAVLSFCKDLTDPRGESVPVGIAGVGTHSPTWGFWCYTTKQQPGDQSGLDLDAISKSVLNDLPSLLERQILQGIEAVSPKEFVSWLHERFRNSLHVSSIHKGILEFDPRDGSELMSRLVREFTELYKRHVIVQPASDEEGVFSEAPNIELRQFAASEALV
jgi:hypothetical protein